MVTFYTEVSSIIHNIRSDFVNNLLIKVVNHLRILF